MLDRTRVIASLCSTVAGTTSCAEAPTVNDMDLDEAARTSSADVSDASVVGDGGFSTPAVSNGASDSGVALAVNSAGDGSMDGALPTSSVSADAGGRERVDASALDAGLAASPAAAAPAVAAPSSAGDASASENTPEPAASDAAAPAPAARCTLPAEAQPEDVSRPTTVVGTGTAASCTPAAFVAAVAQGGVITFDCGAAPATITLDQTAKVFNDKSQKVVIDGGGRVTLSGGGRVRILYQNTCDESQVWTTDHCDNQEYPQLTVQNITFASEQ